jgi:sarcosine/dimethylglycine N-methyltransferase
MIDVLDGVRDHYRATGLTERLKTALAAIGPEDQQLTPQQLAALDQLDGSKNLVDRLHF